MWEKKKKNLLQRNPQSYILKDKMSDGKLLILKQLL